jgi:hypothetical protein
MVVCLSFGLAQAQEMIIDGTFDSDNGAWLVEANDGGDLFFEMADGHGHIEIDGIGSNPWSMQLKQKLTVVNGKKYDISFDIKSNGADSIGVWIQQDHPSFILVDEKTFHPTADWQTFSYTSAEWDENDDTDAKLTFVFKEVEVGNEIWIDNVSMSEEGTLIGIKEDFASQPLEFSLSQNYPNPFNPTTTIGYNIPKANYVVLKVYDVQGKEITTLVNGLKSSGQHQISWDGKDKNGLNVASGIYLYKLIAGDVVKSNKMLLVK